MTAADTNVGPGRRSPAATARGARPVRLARLLLKFLLQKLDRKAALLSLFAASLMPACVIPVGPEWQDPLGIPNGPPRIVASDPPLGKALTADANNRATFSIRVTDPNPGQTLHLRWLAEFPEDIPETSDVLNVMTDRLLPHAGGQPWEETVTETFGCIDFRSGLPSHKVMAIVADDVFDVGQPTGVTNGGGSDAIFWPLNITCESQNQ